MKWLLVTQDQVDEINALLPQDTRVWPVQLQSGSLGLGSDLLTDCGPGGTYEAAGDLLRSLAVVDGSPVVVEG